MAPEHPYTYHYVVLLSRAPKGCPHIIHICKGSELPTFVPCVHEDLNGYETHNPAADGTVQQRVLLQRFTEH